MTDSDENDDNDLLVKSSTESISRMDTLPLWNTMEQSERPRSPALSDSQYLGHDMLDLKSKKLEKRDRIRLSGEKTIHFKNLRSQSRTEISWLVENYKWLP